MKEKISVSIPPENSIRKWRTMRGFSMIESLAVVGIIGIMAVLFVPSVQNSLETRTMDSMALDVRTHLQKTKFFAVKSKLNSRILFFQNSEIWTYTIEVEQSSGTWTTIPNYIDQVIPSKYSVTVTLPDDMVIFSPLGIVTNFDPNQNEIIIQSSVLAQYNQPDTRTVMIYAGGTVGVSGLSAESGGSKTGSKVKKPKGSKVK